MKLKILKENYLLTLILSVAALVRFVGITWAFPFNPHPDEWNMAHAVSQLSFKEALNPRFFAYGQFPLYLSFFSAKIYNLIPWIHLPAININEATFFLRFWSAVAGVGTVYLTYLISKKILLKKSLIANYYLLITPLLASFTPGLIQISHFGTTESFLSFFFLAIIYFSLKVNEKPTLNNFLSAGFFLGLALGTKVSALVFIAPILLASFFLIVKAKTVKNKLGIVLFTISTLALSLSLAFLTSPYLFLNFQESKRILFYEMQVATGQAEVFYTRQFFNTIPIVFQFTKIFPFTLGWPILLIGTGGIVLSWVIIVKQVTTKIKNLNFNLQLLTLNFAFLTYFFSQAFLFCKWTRFMTPIFAFFPIFAGVFLSYLRNLRHLRYLSYLIVVFALFPGAFFSSIYFRPDIRFTASEWIYKNIPENSKILYDTGNVVDIPVRPTANRQPPTANYEVVSFDFYHLDENPELFPQLLTHLQTSDYIFVPSKRLYANALRLPEKFPKTAKYYQLLFSGKLGFKEIKTFFPFPQLLITNYQLLISDEAAEETFTVFDHPVIRIYEKTKKFAKEDYNLLFKNDFI